jgi:uncharacterized protein with PIN domain
MKESFLYAASIRVYEELNDFLPSGRRKRMFSYPFFGKPTVKDVIESLGIPHTEVDLILLNGESVSFDAHLSDGDRLSVYPRFESLDIRPLQRLRPEPLRETRFIVDVHLGKLARYLRMLGFDTFYDPALEDEQIIEKSLHEERIILTRDLGILKNSRVKHGYFVRQTKPKEQAREIVRRFDLKNKIFSFSRCLECNTPLQPLEKETAMEYLSPETLRYYDAFFFCPSCEKIYWEGSHFKKMSKFISGIIG